MASSTRRLAAEDNDIPGFAATKEASRSATGGSNLTGVAARRAKPKEIELELDTKGWVAGIQGSEFSSPRELGDLLAKTPQCQECLVKQVFRYMSGRQDTPADRPVLNQALEDFRKSDFHFKELMVALVKSSEFPDSRRTGNVAGHH